MLADAALNAERLKIFFMHPEAKMPVRATALSAGYDLFCVEGFRLHPGMQMLVRTGIAMAIPEGLVGRIAPRSGLAVMKGIDVLAGVIDADYRGEVGVCLVNHGKQNVVFTKRAKIAQIILEKISTPEVRVVNSIEELGQTGRGSGGFGSTDAPSAPAAIEVAAETPLG